MPATVTVKSSGNQSATPGTDHTLLDTADNGVYVLVVDAAALANGETLTLRISRGARSGDAIRLAYEASFRHALGQPLIISPPVPCPHGAVFTLRQDGGSGRSYPWEVEAL